MVPRRCDCAELARLENASDSSVPCCDSACSTRHRHSHRRRHRHSHRHRHRHRHRYAATHQCYVWVKWGVGSGEWGVGSEE